MKLKGIMKGKFQEFLLVERMTATTDLESEREIQNAMDKKRKKRKSVHITDSSVKQLRLDCKYERIGV